MAEPVGEPEAVEDGVGAGVELGALAVVAEASLGDHGGDENILENGEFGEEVVELEDEADGGGAVAVEGAGGHAAEGVAAEENLASHGAVGLGEVGSVESAEDVEEG